MTSNEDRDSRTELARSAARQGRKPIMHLDGMMYEVHPISCVQGALLVANTL